MILSVKVIPNAHKNQIVGWENGELKVRIAAIPEKGEANDELIAFLAKHFKIRKSSIQLISGATSRHKRLKIDELNENLIN